MLDPEKSLIKKAQSGNSAAYGKLVDRYYEMVYAVAFGVVRNREMAQDVTQNVFLKAFSKIKKFQGKSKLKTWLYRIAYNASIDEVRRRKPTSSIDMTDASSEDDEAPNIIVDEGPSPLEHASQDELRETMKKALEALTPDHRVVLVLREWQGLSYDEIAETLEIEVGTVMSRIFYARKRLRQVLENTKIKESEGSKK